MDNPRPEKVAVVNEVRERFDQASAAILTEYRGLTVKDLATLRRSLRDAGGEYRIYKNTLVRFAARDLGLGGLDALLTGPTAIAFVDGDAVGVAKALREYARTNPNLVVKGGVLGTTIMSADDTTALADLPPREVVLARLAGALAAPMQQFAGLLQALPRNFAYGLKALIEQGGPAASESSGPAASESSGPAASESSGPAASESSGPAASESSGPAASESSGAAVDTANPDEGNDAAPEPA
jgi:large subunit ribosomal protein L10